MRSGRTARVKVSIWQVMYPPRKPCAAYAKKYSHFRLNIAYSVGSRSDGCAWAMTSCLRFSCSRLPHVRSVRG